MSAYETDIVDWSERQAALLRRRAAGEIVNDTELDWINIAEEIEDVGDNKVDRAQSLITVALLHLLKLRSWPDALAVNHWRVEVRAHLSKPRRDCRREPRLRARISLTDAYEDAVASMPPDNDGTPCPPLPEACPWSLDDLLADDVSGLLGT